MKSNLKNIVKQYSELLTSIKDKNVFMLDVEERLRFQDTLDLLEERGYITYKKLLDSSSYAYKVLGSLDDFHKWLLMQQQEAKRLSRREWIIAVISAIIGGLIGLIPTIISLLEKTSA